MSVLLFSLEQLEERGVIKLGRGKIISKTDLESNPGNFPVYSSSKVGDGKFGEYGFFMFDEELITWSVDGGGKLFHREKHKFSITNVTGFLRILKTEIIEYKYLFYCLTFLHSSIQFDWVKKAHPSVLRKEYKNIPIPSLATQKKIVTKLDAIFAEIDKATAAAEANAKNAEALFQRYLNEVFERGSDDWEVYTIKDLIKIRSGDFLPAKNMMSDGLIDVYGGNGISGKHNVHNLSGDNIIIGRVGAKCGNVRLVSGDIWVTDNAFYVSEYKTNIHKEFLSIALELKNLRSLANQMAQPVISFTTIKDAELKIPCSLETQVEFLKVKKFLEHQVKIISDSFAKKSELLSLLKQAILKQAFAGELVKE